MLIEMSATGLARGIREGEFSSLEVVDAHIERIEAVNQCLNAMVEERFEAARSEAADADSSRAQGRELPPLHGVPCTIKEFFGVEGMHNTGGIYSHRERLAPGDASDVARLKEAGAIILGTTNAPEGGLWMETYNKIYGRTSNPWDLKRTSGGSSGGEGALVASGGSPLGLGSDVGGSIRIPAAFCGTVCHKPSGGLFPNTGHFPPAPGGNGAFLCSGPLVRRVEDLWPLIQILSGPDGVDPACRSFSLGDPGAVDLSELVVYPMESNGRQGVQKVMRQAVRDGARALEQRGATVREVELPRMKKALDIWVAMLSDVADTHYPEILGSEGQPIRPFWELLKCGVGQSNFTAIAVLTAGLDGLTSRFKKRIARFVEMGEALRAELDELLGTNGVILHPPYGRPAPRHWDAMRTPFSPAHTAIFNVMESPVTCLPLSWSEKNLPISIQIVGAPGQDHLTVAAAAALESDFGGWRRAPVIEET
jgi:fatty acid amide hydrolase 2